MPAGRAKSGRSHIVALSRQAVAPACDAPVFTTAGGARLGNWDRATKRIMAASGTSGWHRHDVRRSGATLLGELGVEPHVIEAALNHTHVGGPTKATPRSDPSSAWVMALLPSSAAGQAAAQIMSALLPRSSGLRSKRCSKSSTSIPSSDRDKDLRRALAQRLLLLDRLEVTFGRMAFEDRDAAVGALLVKVAERRATLLGLDPSLGHAVHVVQHPPERREASTDKIERALNALIEDQRKNGSSQH